MYAVGGVRVFEKGSTFVEDFKTRKMSLKGQMGFL